MFKEREKEGADTRTLINSPVIEFIKEAVADGAPHRMLEGAPKRYSAGRARELNFIGTYYYTPAILEDMAQIYSVSRQNVHRVLKDGVKRLWQYSSPPTQERFPLSNLPLEKPPCPKGRVRLVANKIACNPQITKAKLQEEFKLAERQMSNLEQHLKGRGIRATGFSKDILSSTRSRALAEKFRHAQESEIPDLLKHVTYTFYQHYSKGEGALLVQPHELLDAVGLLHNPRRIELLMETLAKSEIPYGVVVRDLPLRQKKMKYFFIARQDKERAVEILKRTLNLRSYFIAKSA